MKPEFEKYDLIDRYLSGELSGSQLQDVENKINSDPGFKADVASQKAANAFIMDSGLIELKKKMDSYRPIEKSVPRTLQLFIVATGISLLAGFMIWYNTNRGEAELTQSSEVKTEAFKEEVLVSSDEEMNTNEFDSESAIIEEEINISEEEQNFDGFGVGEVVVSSEVVENSTETIATIPIEREAIVELTEEAHKCMPTSLFPKVSFDEYYKSVDVEIATYGSLEEPFTFLVNDEEVSNFLGLRPESCVLKVIDQHGCVGTAELTITPIEE